MAGFADEVIYSLFAKQSEDWDLLHEDLEQIDDLDIEEMDINWQIVMIAIRMKKFYKKTRRRVCVDGKTHVGFDKKKLECFNYEDEETNHALMAISSSSEVIKRSTILAYSQAVKKLEAQLVTFQKQQLSLNEKLTFQANEIYEKDEKLKRYRRIGMKAVKEKEQLQKTLDSWKDSSKNLWRLINSGMSSNNKLGLGYEIQSNNEVLSYEEEMNFSVFNCSEEDSVGKPLYSRFIKTNDFKGVPHPLSGDYTPTPQEEIDESLYISSVPPEVQPIKDQATHKVNRKNWNDMMERELGEGYSFTKKKCFICGSQSHLIKDCDYYEKKMAREAEFKKQRVFNTGNGVAKPVWTNANRVNHANQFVPRSVQLNAESNTGSSNVNSVRSRKPVPTKTSNSFSPKRPQANKTPTPVKGFACFIAKATSDESKMWHRRLGHINFKNLNKLVKGNLVRGLPSKVFRNDHTCVACHKGKQHRASCKAKLERLIIEPLHTLHMDLFRPTSIKSINHASYCLVITDDCTRFSWVFFLASKDETSGILQNFIRQIENQLNHRVKIIRSDNGTEFKNRDMLEFCRNKGIKQEYSNARTPQQNGVAKRMNMTLIMAAKTMRADSLLPTTFWTEAISTACYVLNRIRVTKPQNKTPYELLFGQKLIISYIRPFGRHVTILDTLSVLGKFDGKSNEGFLVGYSLNSKAYKVYNLVTKRVEVNLHVNFLEDKPNVKGEKDDDAELIVVPSAIKITAKKVETRKSSANSKKEEILKEPQQEKEATTTGTLENNPKILAFRKELEAIAQKHLGTVPETNSTSILSVNSGSEPVNTVEFDPDDSAMLELEIFHHLPTEIKVSPTPTLRIHNIHPKSQILGDPKSAVQTRSKEEPKRVSDALQDDSWVQAMQEELLQFKLQQVWVLVDLPHGMKVIGTKWVYKNKRDERGVVVRNKARLVAQSHRQEEGIDYDKVFSPVARMEAIRLFLAFASFMGFIVYQMDVKSAFLYGTIDEEVYVSQTPGFVDPDHPKKVYKYVADMLKKFDLRSVKTAITPMETNMALTKDEDGADVDVNTKVSHLLAVKRIFKYLKGKPNLGLWYPRESPFDLEAFSDSDYGGSNLDRKSTIGGCQFLGQRLISWQCKKYTIMATSTTKAEYVAAVNCCRQVLWVQNQLLDYGFNFMNTKIHIDNKNTIFIMRNLVYHSKTKHIEIHHHFIRDCYEKKLIRVEKIHTDLNVADLLTKPFDGPRFNFLVVSIGMINP
ncbi:putative ribonuclease H-like domain-containing protein [Tanacetum coccineum]